MLKKTIVYTDYNGVERQEDFYFNLSKAELIEMELGTDGGYGEKIQKIVNAKDVKALINIFKELTLKSYGVKSEDGKRFMKSEEISAAFAQSEAYSTLFMELASNDKAASEFIKGILPGDLASEVEKQTKAVPMPNK